MKQNDSKIIDELSRLLNELERLLTHYSIDEVSALSPHVEYLYEIPLMFNDLRKQIKDQLLSDEVISLIKGKLNINVNDFVKILKVLEKSIKDIEEVLNRYPSKESMIVELSKNKHLLERLMKVVVSHNNYLDIFNEKINQLKRAIQSHRGELIFRGRNGLKEESELRELEDLIDGIRECIREYESLCSDAYNQLINFAISMVELGTRNEYLRDVLSQIYARIEHGLWARELLDVLTGLQSITASPIAEPIYFILSDDISYEDLIRLSLSLRDLFTQYPPFEPIALRRRILIRNGRRSVEADVAGSHVWFIESPNLTERSLRVLRSLKTDATNVIINAREQDSKYAVELKEVIPVNILSKIGELILEIKPRNAPRIWIKYGSRGLRDLFLIKQCSKKALQTIYEREVARERGIHYKAYRVDNLSYVWFCIRGRGLSADPWDFKDCPFKKKLCFYGKSFKGERCPYWSYSRRIFPKVFPIIEKKIYGLSIKQSSGLLIPLKANGVLLNEMYVGVQWNMPSTRKFTGIPVQLRFKKRLIRSLPKTNVVGFALPLKVIYAFVESLLDPSFKPKPEFVPGVNMRTSTTIIQLLFTKLFLYHEGERGLRVYKLLSDSRKSILKKYSEFLKKLKSEKVKEFIAQVLGHTLAHLLVSFLAESLELELQDLIYYYDIDKENGLLVVLVAENSPYGSLNLVEHVHSKFDSLENMIRTFFQRVCLMLKNHEEELEEHKKQRRLMLQKYYSSEAGKMFKPLIEKLNEYYDNLVSQGLVLDSNYFVLHLILSHTYERMAQRLKIDSRLALQELDTILTYAGPELCLDGCTGCIVFERGCEDPLAQTLTLSRKFVQLFLNFLFNGEMVIVRGDKLGPALIETLPKEELIVKSPYVDKEGIELLQKLARNGINVVLITRESTIRKYSAYIRGLRIGIPKKPFHEKIFIIDRQIIVHSSWNLTLKYKSTNQFRIEYNPNRASLLRDQIMSEVKLIDQDSGRVGTFYK